ncbi:hypothetical protein ES703_121039 [subsurface metagenome]
MLLIILPSSTLGALGFSALQSFNSSSFVPIRSSISLAYPLRIILRGCSGNVEPSITGPKVGSFDAKVEPLSIASFVGSALISFSKGTLRSASISPSLILRFDISCSEASFRLKL